MNLEPITESNQLPALYASSQPANLQLNVSPLFSIDILDAALVQSEEKLREGDQKISNLGIEFAFNLGRKYEILKQEERTLKKEIILQHRHIEILVAVHQEKWTACLEAAKVRMQAISHEISKIIQSIETFKKQYPKPLVDESGKVAIGAFIDLGGEAEYCKVSGTLQCQDRYISTFKEWLKTTEEFSFDEGVRKFPQYRSKVETVVSAESPQTIVPIGIPLQMASFIQNMQALEKEVASLKQELHALERSQELKEKDHQDSIAELKWESHRITFEPQLEMAKSFQDIIDSNIKRAAEWLHDMETKGNVWSGRRKIHAAFSEESERLKSMIGTIISLIQEADEWAKQGEIV